MSVNQNIFKAYDIRGLYPEEINEDAAYRIGWGFIEFLKNNGELPGRKIIIGRDARLSSDSLFEALCEGIISQAVDVIDIGKSSTPLFYWAVINEKADGGIMITASHNPAQYNGFKVCGRAAVVFGLESGLRSIRELAGKTEKAIISPYQGKIISKNLISEFIDFVSKKESLERIKPLKIVFDCGNGMIGSELFGLVKKIPGQTDILFGEPDGSFPNHEANPSKQENLKTLKEKVLAQKADLGIAFDGDGDRIVFLDENGEQIRGDLIAALIAKEVLQKEKGKKILYEVRTGKIVPETIKEYGGIPVIGRPGHTLMKEQMRNENIFFGGELTGHYFFQELGNVENPLIVMIEILSILGRGQSFSQVIAPFKKYFSSGEINFEVQDADKIIAEIEKHFSDGQVKKIDGLTVEYPDWWFNLRKSNTEPLVRLNIETNTRELMEEKKGKIVELITTI